jgi:hypothetical protein
MNRRTTRRLLAGILIGAIGCLTVALGGDVTVQQGNITATGLTLTGSATITGSPTVTGDLDVEGDLVGDHIDSDYIGYNSYPQGYFDNVTVNWDVDAYWVWGDAVGCRQFLAQEISYFLDDVKIYGALAVYGKFSPEGGIDPPYLLCDKQTRQEIIEKVRKEVPPEKQGGAALFFNADNHQLETYVPAEGKFYNLSGTVVQTLPAVIAPATQYKPWYHLDRESGQVKSSPKPVSNKYQLKSGCRLDEATGQFINEHTGEAVPREQAVEVYNPSDRTYYDLEGKALRTEQNPAQVEYVTEYYLDRHTGEVKSERRPVRQLYVVKKGLRFDKKTGQFTDAATGNAVAAQDAVVQIRQ